MDNITLYVKSNILTITVDLSHDGGLSKSQKSTLIASTHGNIVMTDTDDAVLSLNIYRPLA